MKSLPSDVVPYKRTEEFNESSVPAGLLKQHATKAGVWGRIVVEEGRLLYRNLASNEVVTLDPSSCGVIEPEVPHEVEPKGHVRFWVEFLRRAK